MALKTYRWDMADYVETYEDVDAHLEIAYEDYDPAHVEEVMNAIVRSNAMSKLAEKWAVDGCIGAYIQEQSEKTLHAYRSQPNLVAEHANTEEDTARGGYAHRQLFELVQNGADALSLSDGGQIWIRLTPAHLYCADEGRAIDEGGVKALMFSHLSPKRGTDEIGRFGLGFKSVLGVTDSPEFFSRSGSFRFDRATAAALIRNFAPDAERFPAIRLPESIHPIREAAADPVLREMMGWATNVVRLPLKPEAHQSLDKQIKEFPSEFLLFVEHVGRLAVRQGALGRRGVFERLADHFLIDSYDPPDFALRLARKDVDLACQVGRQYDVPMKLASLALAEMTEALNRGWADRDSRVAMTLQEERAGVKVNTTAEAIREAVGG